MNVISCLYSKFSKQYQIFYWLLCEVCFLLGRLQSILSEGVRSDSSDVQKICLNGWTALMRCTQVETTYLTELVEVCTDMKLLAKCDQSVKDSLLFLLKNNIKIQEGFTQMLKSKLCLAGLVNISNEDKFLKDLSYQIEEMNGKLSLLDQNCIQLANILDKQEPSGSFGNKQRVLTLLNSCKQTSNFNKELLESVAILYESVKSEEIKSSCLQLLLASSSDSKTSSIRVTRILNEYSERSKAEAYRKQFLVSSSPLRNIFKEQLKLHEEQIKSLFSIFSLKDFQQLQCVKNLEEFLGVALNNNSNGCFPDSHAFVYIIEKLLVSATNITENKIALTCYCKLIKHLKFHDLKSVIENLLTLSSQKMEADLIITVIECIFLSLPYLFRLNFQTALQSLSLLETHLEHNCVLVRVLSFAGLSLASDYFSIESKFFTNWCYEKIKELSNLTNVEFNEGEYLDILYVIISLKSIDLDVFHKPRDVWHRELLISNMFHELGPCADTEKLDFYNLWLQIEEKQFPEFQSIAFLFHLNLKIHLFNKSLLQVNEVLFILNQSESVPLFYEYTNDELILYFQQELKEAWCMKLIECSINAEIDQAYLKQLTKLLCANFSADTIQLLLNCILCIDNLKEFESLIEFCSEKKDRQKLEKCLLKKVQCSNMNDFKNWLEVEYLCYHFASPSANVDQLNILYSLFREMLTKNKRDKNWSFEQLNSMVVTIKTYQVGKCIIQIALEAFQVISFHQLSPAMYTECVEILKEPDSLKNLNILVVKNKFCNKDSTKNYLELLQELDKDNCRDSVSSVQLNEYIKTKLSEQLDHVKSPLLRSSVVDHNLPISQWERKHIAQWAEGIKATKNKSLDIVEAIAVIRRANFWHTGFLLTDTQILTSLLSLYNYDSNEAIRGKLLQVATGEGKSTIVCILAIVNALRGEGAAGGINKVDVITSSPVLAERDAKEKARLFRMFDLKCSFNGDTMVYVTGKNYSS